MTRVRWACDLRSDTLTQPVAAMRRLLAEAPVGDDVYGEDPSITEFEQRVAELCGKPAGLFCATGSLSNLLGVQALVAPGQEVLCDADAHIARAELGAHGALHGVTMRTWLSREGVADLEQLDRMLAPDAGPYLVSTAAVALENTHNFAGGTIQPLEHLQAVATRCRQVGVRLHLDGARLWNAHVETGVAIADYAACFDTISLCFSKGLGAPVGSVLVASSEVIARARVQRKRLGAGWRQAGMLAAAASWALTHQVERLVDDHGAARAFAAEVARQVGEVADPERVPTNIVVLDTSQAPGRPRAAQVAEAVADQGVRLSVLGAHTLRAVTHLNVSLDDCRQAGELVGRVLAGR